jgi:hypothetical protein
VLLVAPRQNFWELTQLPKCGSPLSGGQQDQDVNLGAWKKNSEVVRANMGGETNFADSFTLTHVLTHKNISSLVQRNFLAFRGINTQRATTKTAY